MNKIAENLMKSRMRKAWKMKKKNGYEVWNKGKTGLQKGLKRENSPNWNGGYYKNNIPRFDTYAHQISYCENVRKNKEDNNILEVKCAYCGKWHIPKCRNIINRIRALNGKFSVSSEYRLYCSDNCKLQCPIYNRSKWPKGFKIATAREVQPELRQLVFKRDNYTCQKCGKNQDELECGLHCHHKEGILWEPLESADIDKSIAFCKDCHIEVHKLPDCGYYSLRCPESEKENTWEH